MLRKLHGTREHHLWQIRAKLCHECYFSGIAGPQALDEGWTKSFIHLHGSKC